MTEGPVGISATMVEASVSRQGMSEVPIYTMVLRYPRFIHSEFMTHRMFSRNASSSRAIPVKKQLEQIMEYPARPYHWGKNQPGMQAREEHHDPVHVMRWMGYPDPTLEIAHSFSRTEAWLRARDDAAEWAERFNEAGYHKQIVNRLLEPFQFISVVVTATEWENFFTLRDHADAQPEFRELAKCMREEIKYATVKDLNPTDWHLPFVSQADRRALDTETCVKLSVARCARVSYLNHDQSEPDIEKDKGLYDMLLGSGHYSPFEHQAFPMAVPIWGDDDQVILNNLPGVTHYDHEGYAWSGNFRGWVQARHFIEQGCDYNTDMEPYDLVRV